MNKLKQADPIITSSINRMLPTVIQKPPPKPIQPPSTNLQLYHLHAEDEWNNLHSFAGLRRITLDQSCTE